jgi:ADP-ribosylglycohydrolase
VFHLLGVCELIGGAGKLIAYSNLKANFRDGSSFISADVLGKFTWILWEDIRTLPKSGIKSGGFVIDTLEAAFRCFLTTDTYRDAVLKAVNLGEDTGALAGITYGLDAIPSELLETLAASEDIRRIAGAMAKALTG